ncbi:MAG TPA: ATP-binding protein [Steroidobacteraceae bacterium]|nr:ATP-binding protein [Steroidobacteraceae bacterium]
MNQPRPMAADWLVGGGELGALIRAKDWAATPLGPIDDWPQSLRSCISHLLPSRAQIVLFWGPEFVTVYNDAYRPVFGGKHPRVLGLPGRESWSELWDMLQPLLAGVVNTGDAFWAKDLMFMIERHGYVEETYFDVSYDPVRDETGRVGGVFCIVSETTGRVVGERRLAALRDLGRVSNGATSAGDIFRNSATVLENYGKDVPFTALYSWDAAAGTARLEAASGIAAGDAGAPLLIDATNRHQSWPLGSDAEIVLAEPPADVDLPRGPWPEPVKHAAILKLATRANETYGYLVCGLSARRKFDDDYRDFVRLVGANISGALAGVRALEDERRRAEQLAELDRAKTAFFSNVSHEFRTPLTLMLGPLEDLLSRSESLPPDDRALLAVTQRNGVRLLRLVNTLLDFARIEAGRAQASYQPTDLCVLTAELASNFRSACERVGISLVVDCPQLPEPIYVDREMWEKIVLNLLSNAFKFTFEGEIAIRIRDAGSGIDLAVSDTGTGIPPDELPRMFERFHRVENARGRSHEGSGIGLALVSELVKLHGGSIAVDSALGQGTTFLVRIPKGTAHLPAERLRASTASAAAASPRGAEAYVAEALEWLPDVPQTLAPRQDLPRVLLADDNADLREYARRLLSEQYQVHVVADGQAAFEAARELRPDLIISDVMMPRLDGFGLIREVRADPQLRATPIILLSARAGEESRIEGLDRGADDYLVKPFSARELLVRAGTLIRSAELRRRAEEARAQFETLLNAAPLGVMLVDEDFRIAAVNPIALPLIGESDLIGRDFDSLLRTVWSSADAEEITRRFRHTLQTGEPHVVPEFVARRKDRQVMEYYEWQVSRIPLPDGRSGVVCYFRDISRTILAREALREADSRKDEFLATLSHELRNPLAPLRSSLEVIKRVASAPPNAAAALEIMDRQMSHLVRLVDDLLEVSRITRGQVELRREQVRLDAAIHGAIETSEPVIRAGNHRLIVSFPDEPLLLDADPVRLAQIFGNLLNNAAKYSEKGGRIEITARRDGEEALVTIRDSGDGIAPEQVPKLFEIFTRGERSARRNQSGLGIGLALVRRLTEMHGGRVEASSEGVGKGSTFSVRLPLNVRQAAAPKARGREHSSIEELSVLVVDDNKDAAESLAMLLRTAGAEVRVAHDGPTALEEFERCESHVVLLDIGMPDMDGCEVARRLREISRPDRVALVALTGWGQDEDRRRVREAGFDHHLVKPVDLASLQALLTSLARAQSEKAQSA